jgi:hypothetical protein
MYLMKNKNNETTSDIKDDNSETFEDADHDNDWENRVLCHDGNCIGVIGPNGLCKECGKPSEGIEEISGEDTKEEASDSEKLNMDENSVTETEPEETFSHEHDEISDDAIEEPVADETAVPDDDWESRTLCSDGNCIGVIGPNGRCRECGKPL